MQRRLCYISRCYRNAESAGTKAKTDYEKILSTIGGVNVGLPMTYNDSKIISFFLNLISVAMFVFRIRKRDILFLQYPVKKYFVFLCWYAKHRGANTIVFIHDLGSFRREKITVSAEIEKLMNTDYLIAANSAMRKWLLDKGYTHPVGAMGLHDYLTYASPKSPLTVETQKTVVYAGGLAKRKNSFLEKLSCQSISYQLRLYGNNKDLELCMNNNIKLYPFLKDTDFINTIKAHYGLIWDGDSVDECSGAWGEYLKYNSPHKASFYLRAGLPLIIWREAALAPIIEQEGIGISISSLRDLDHILASISVENYKRMLENVRRVSNLISSGYSLRSALSKAIQSIMEVNKV